MNFSTGGTSHIVVVASLALAGFALVHWRRSAGSAAGRKVDLWFATVLACVWPASMAQYIAHGTLNLQNALPLHLCDLALLTGLVALVSRKMWAVELTYYFALAGTSHGLLTPTLDVDWPHPRFMTFFLHHGGVVLAAIYLVVGMKLLPRRNSILTALAGILLYALVVGGLNWLLGTNYGFLCAKPPTASVLDHLGPWPWYVVVLSGIAATIFVLLYQPVRWLRARESAPVDEPKP